MGHGFHRCRFLLGGGSHLIGPIGGEAQVGVQHLKTRTGTFTTNGAGLFGVSPHVRYNDWFMMNSEVPSGKRVRNYGLKKKNMRFSWVNPLFLWPCSIAFCMFTRPGIKYEFIPSKFDMPNPPRDDQRINHPNMLESGKRHSLKGTSPSSRQIGSNRYLQDNICFQKIARRIIE